MGQGGFVKVEIWSVVDTAAALPGGTAANEAEEPRKRPEELRKIIRYGGGRRMKQRQSAGGGRGLTKGRRAGSVDDGIRRKAGFDPRRPAVDSGNPPGSASDQVHQRLPVLRVGETDGPLQPGALGQDVPALPGLEGAWGDDTGPGRLKAVGGNRNQVLVDIAGHGQRVGHEIGTGAVSALAGDVNVKKPAPLARRPGSTSMVPVSKAGNRCAPMAISTPPLRFRYSTHSWVPSPTSSPCWKQR